MEELTHSEEAVMRIVWELGEGVVHDIIEKLPDPKPPYTTVSSIIRLLEKKGYVHHRAYGKTHLYFPLIPKQDFTRQSFKTMIQHYFDGSPKQVVSFLVQEQKLEAADIEELKRLIDSYVTPKTEHD